MSARLKERRERWTEPKVREEEETPTDETIRSLRDYDSVLVFSDFGLGLMVGAREDEREDERGDRRRRRKKESKDTGP